MSLIDLSIGIVLLWAIYKGFTKGFIVAAASCVSFAIGIWGSIRFSQYLVPIIRERFSCSSSQLPLIAFLFTFLCIILLIYLLAKLLEKLVEGMALGPANKIGGAVFNCSKYLLVIAVLIFILHTVENSYPVISKQSREKSILYTPLEKTGLFIFPSLKTIVQQKFIFDK